MLWGRGGKEGGREFYAVSPTKRDEKSKRDRESLYRTFRERDQAREREKRREENIFISSFPFK